MLVPESTDMAMSPARISFSYNLCCQSVPAPEHQSSSPDFDFCIRKSLDQHSSSADELFSNGKIIPTQIIKKKSEPPLEYPPASSNKSFWGFKRSSSLNGGRSRYGPSLCPLPLLSRSNSTGSWSKASPTPNANQKAPISYHHKPPPLKKAYGSHRVNPVLNVPAVNIFAIFRDKTKPLNK